MTILKRSNGYSKVDKEDPEDQIHRRARFLIYKAMEQADCRRKQSFIRIRLCRLKVKIGKRLKKLKKSVLISVSVTKMSVYKYVANRLKTWRRLFNSDVDSHRRGTMASALPRPLFT